VKISKDSVAVKIQQVRNIKHPGSIHISITQTYSSEEHHVFMAKVVQSGLSMGRINRIINPNTTETIELVMIDWDILFTDGVMSIGTQGITARQNEDQGTMELAEIRV